jgi:hypothetical protein
VDLAHLFHLTDLLDHEFQALSGFKHEALSQFNVEAGVLVNESTNRSVQFYYLEDEPTNRSVQSYNLRYELTNRSVHSRDVGDKLTNRSV